VPSDQQALDFEQSLRELESVVERLERGDLPLEEALRVFERGVDLTRQCQGALRSAQQRVDALMKRNGELEPEPFSVSDTARDGATEVP
jgi:exodeoxyribonuclease VII small subunit